jgi:hypothetical protein
MVRAIPAEMTIPFFSIDVRDAGPSKPYETNLDVRGFADAPYDQTPSHLTAKSAGWE